MFQKIIRIFKIKDLRNKILFVLGVFIIFRIMANIPIPGIDRQALTALFERFQMLGILNLFTGGALDKLSIVMLGLGPYITAVIILQLLTMIFPQLERIYKEEGEAGRQKFNQYGRILAVPLSALQGYAMLTIFQRQNPPVIGVLSPAVMISSIVVITAGSILMMWLGELISEKGIGDGISLLIFAGIIADFPNSIGQMINDLSLNPNRTPAYLAFFSMSLLIVAGVAFITEAKRKIPVSYAKRVRGMRLYGGASTYLPLNINPAGVMPIIFALSILTFPPMIAGFFQGREGLIGQIAQKTVLFFQSPVVYGVLLFVLVVVFVFFYTAVTFDPKSISDNLQKMGGFVPGIRPGRPTASHLSFILNRILIVGALFLGTIAVMPSIIQGVTKVESFRFLIGGTGLLILVNVVLETVRQINAQLEMREYETF